MPLKHESEIFLSRPIYAHIHTDALSHNLERIRQLVPGSKVWSVVKANAYGHGLEPVLKGLALTDGFALLDLAEAKALTSTCNRWHTQRCRGAPYGVA